MENCRGSVLIELDEEEAKDFAPVVQYLYERIPDRLFKTFDDEEFAARYPELVTWATAFIAKMNEENRAAMKHDKWLGDGLLFADNRDFEPDFVIPIVQQCIKRYGIAPVAFDYSLDLAYGGNVDPDGMYGVVVKVFEDRFEEVTTNDIIREFWKKVAGEDLVACAQAGDLEKFKVLYSSKEDWGSQAKDALKMAVRMDVKAVFDFLVDQGVKVEDAVMARLCQRRPAYQAVLDAQKLAEHVSTPTARPMVSRNVC